MMRGLCAASLPGLKGDLELSLKCRENMRVARLQRPCELRRNEEV